MSNKSQQKYYFLYKLTKLNVKLLGLSLLCFSIFLGACTASPTEPPPSPTEAPASTPEPAEVVDGAADQNQDNAESQDATEDESTVPSDVKVIFLQPTHNAIVPPNFKVVMHAEGVAIEAAGEVRPGAGHMHILINQGFIAPGDVIPKNLDSVHYGEGETEAELSLEPGIYTLLLQFGDGSHIALAGEQYRHEIVVTVKEDALPQAVRIVAPTDGAIVPENFNFKMAASGLIVEPAGEVREGAIHMHVLVDTNFVTPGEAIPNDEQHLHYGDGAIETDLKLSPGPHTLRLQAANGAHIALDGPQYRDEINVIVQENAPEQSVRFISPANGETVPRTFSIKMAATGMVIETAGRNRDGATHLHVLVNADFVAVGKLISKDDQHLHYNLGELETELTLTPGVHTLRLQASDGIHFALRGEQYRDEITVTVAE